MIFFYYPDFSFVNSFFFILLLILNIINFHVSLSILYSNEYWRRLFDNGRKKSFIKASDINSSKKTLSGSDLYQYVV